jgi:hypothetical protein
VSDETISIVRIDPNDADEVVSRAIAFLMSENLIVPNPKRDAPCNPASGWRPDSGQEPTATCPACGSLALTSDEYVLEPGRAKRLDGRA